VSTTENRRTALYGKHVEHGGRIVPFAGFDMPVQYGGILREHEAVRKRAGLFDLSHMAQFMLRGDEVGQWADRLTINNVATMKVGQARYNIFTSDSGGAHDDVLFYRLADADWMLVVNAANAEKMWRLLEAERARGVELENRHGSRALLAVQGPRAAGIVTGLAADVDRDKIRGMKYYTVTPAIVAGVEALVARTGYTGEDGFELFVEGADAPHVWDALLAAGKGEGLEPCGLGARDILRLEAGMPLYGHEMSEEISPLAAGQRWAIKFDKPEFTGKAALEAQAAGDDYPRIAGIIMEGRVPAREGYAVYHDGERAGEVRSAAVAPSVGNKSIATVYVGKDAAQAGAHLDVEIRGSRHAARVVALPFYTRPKGQG
jgi:aminomethyltransferase